jgi:hypothetical protein
MSQWDSHLRPASGWQDSPPASRAEHVPLSEQDKLCFDCWLPECKPRSRDCPMRVAAREAALSPMGEMGSPELDITLVLTPPSGFERLDVRQKRKQPAVRREITAEEIALRFGLSLSQAQKALAQRDGKAGKRQAQAKQEAES